MILFVDKLQKTMDEIQHERSSSWGEMEKLKKMNEKIENQISNLRFKLNKKSVRRLVCRHKT